jgi:hypothetical protein
VENYIFLQYTVGGESHVTGVVYVYPPKSDMLNQRLTERPEIGAIHEATRGDSHYLPAVSKELQGKPDERRVQITGAHTQAIQPNSFWAIPIQFTIRRIQDSHIERLIYTAAEERVAGNHVAGLSYKVPVTGTPRKFHARTRGNLLAILESAVQQRLKQAVNLPRNRIDYHRTAGDWSGAELGHHSSNQYASPAAGIKHSQFLGRRIYLKHRGQKRRNVRRGHELS